jgi:hypothetical protein
MFKPSVGCSSVLCPGGASDMAWRIGLAYIDPVSGSILIQAVVAAGAGAVAFFRRSIWGVIRRVTGQRDDPVPPPTPGSGDRDQREN